uniref:C2H2-type domain-containing protein n=2 Tax=Tetranychus urticae TaxID=32264 RepID=T1L6D5_TETUR
MLSGGENEVAASPASSTTSNQLQIDERTTNEENDQEMNDQEGGQEDEQDGGQGNEQSAIDNESTPSTSTGRIRHLGLLQFQKSTPKGPVFCRVGCTKSLWKVKKIIGVWVSNTGNALIKFKWGKMFCTPESMHDMGDLDQYPQLTKEEVVEDAECYEEAEAAAIEEVKKHPIVFQCDYCNGTFNALKGLKEHLFGVVREGNGKNRYRVVSCPQRFARDKVTGYERLKCPVKLNQNHPVKKKVWAWVYCQDDSLVKPNGDFDVPPNIQAEWDKEFNKPKLVRKSQRNKK